MIYDINIGVTQSYTINGCGFDNLSMGVVNEMFKDGSLPKELENRVTLRKGK